VLADLGPEHAEAAAWALHIVVIDPRGDLEDRLGAAKGLAGRESGHMDGAAESLKATARDRAEDPWERCAAAWLLGCLGPAFVPDSAQEFRALAADAKIPVSVRSLTASWLSGVADEYREEGREVLRSLTDHPDCSPDDRQFINAALAAFKVPSRSTDDEEQAARPVIT
jgi:hypothetical protein